MTKTPENGNNNEEVKKPLEQEVESDIELKVLPENTFERDNNADLKGKKIQKIMNLGDKYKVVFYKDTDIVSIYDENNHLDNKILDFSIPSFRNQNEKLASVLNNENCRLKTDTGCTNLFKVHNYLDRYLGIEIEKEKLRKILDSNLSKYQKSESEGEETDNEKRKEYVFPTRYSDNSESMTDLFGEISVATEGSFLVGDYLVKFKNDNFDQTSSTFYKVKKGGEFLPPEEWRQEIRTDIKFYDGIKSRLTEEEYKFYDDTISRTRGEEPGRGWYWPGRFGSLKLTAYQLAEHEHPQNNQIIGILTQRNIITILDKSRGDEKRWISDEIDLGTNTEKGFEFDDFGNIYVFNNKAEACTCEPISYSINKKKKNYYLVKLPGNTTCIKNDPKGDLTFFTVGEKLKVFSKEKNAIIKELEGFRGEFELDSQGNIIIGDTQGRTRMIQTNLNELQSVQDKKREEEAMKEMEAMLTGKVVKKETKKVETKETKKESKYKKLQDVALATFQSKIDAIEDREDFEAINKEIQEYWKLMAQKSEAMANDIMEPVRAVLKKKEEKILLQEQEKRAVEIYKTMESIQQRVGGIANYTGISSVKREVEQLNTELKNIPKEKRDTEKEKALRSLQGEIKKKVEEYSKPEHNEEVLSDLKEQRDKVIKRINGIQELSVLTSFEDDDPDYNSLLVQIRDPQTAAMIPVGHELSGAKIKANIVAKIKSRKLELTKAEREYKANEKKRLEEQLKALDEAIDSFVDNIEEVQQLEEKNLKQRKSYQRLLDDIGNVPEEKRERKMRYLQDRIREKRKEINPAFDRFTGELSFLKNDPDLYFEDSKVKVKRTQWRVDTKINGDKVRLSFKDNNGREVLPQDRHVLKSKFAYEFDAKDYPEFEKEYKKYSKKGIEELKELRKESQQSELNDMEKRAIHIASVYKKLWLFNGHKKRNVPKLNENYVYTEGVKESLKNAARKLKTQINSGKGMLLLEGDTGTGKDFLVDILLAETNREQFVFDCTKWTEISDVTYSFVFDGKTIKVPSTVIQALETPGAALYFNEFNTLSPEIIKFLNSLLSHRRSITTTDGKTVTADPSVLFLGSMNGRQGYKGINQLSPDAKGRIDYITVDYPPEKMTEESMTKEMEQLKANEGLGMSLRTAFKDNSLLALHKDNEIAKITKEALKIENLDSIETSTGKAEKISKAILEDVVLPKQESEKEKDVIREVINAIDGKTAEGNDFYSPDEAMMVYHQIPLLTEMTPAGFKCLWHVIVNKREDLMSNEIRELQGNRELYSRIETAMITLLMFVKAANMIRVKFRDFQEKRKGTPLQFIMSPREVDACATTLGLVI